MAKKKVKADLGDSSPSKGLGNDNVRNKGVKPNNEAAIGKKKGLTAKERAAIIKAKAKEAEKKKAAAAKKKEREKAKKAKEREKKKSKGKKVKAKDSPPREKKLRVPSNYSKIVKAYWQVIKAVDVPFRKTDVILTYPQRRALLKEVYAAYRALPEADQILYNEEQTYYLVEGLVVSLKEIRVPNAEPFFFMSDRLSAELDDKGNDIPMWSIDADDRGGQGGEDFSLYDVSLKEMVEHVKSNGDLIKYIHKWFDSPPSEFFVRERAGNESILYALTGFTPLGSERKDDFTLSEEARAKVQRRYLKKKDKEDRKNAQRNFEGAVKKGIITTDGEVAIDYEAKVAELKKQTAEIEANNLLLEKQLLEAKERADKERRLLEESRAARRKESKSQPPKVKPLSLAEMKSKEKIAREEIKSKERVAKDAAQVAIKKEESRQQIMQMFRDKLIDLKTMNKLIKDI